MTDIMSKTKIDYSKLDKATNKSFQPLFTNKDRWLILIGGAGSGKSFAVTQKLILRIIMAARKGRTHKFLCLRKTQPAARKSILALFKDCISTFGLAGKVKINLTDMTIKLFGSEIIITGMDDEEKIKSIHGISSIWLEEMTEFTFKEFMQLDLRLRGILPDYKQIMGSFNPIDENHWIRKELFGDDLQAELERTIASGGNTVRKVTKSMVDGKEIETAMTVMHSTCDDNEFIDPEYKAVLNGLADKDANFHRVYRMGMWGVLKGLIFEKWETTKDWPVNPDDGGFGMDFGYATDPTAVPEIAFDGNDLYAREVLYETKLTNPDIHGKMAPIASVADYDIVSADNAEPKSIAELRQLGLNIVPCAKGKDSIAHGIQRIKQYNLKVDYASPNLIKELQSYKWAENKDGSLKNPPKPVDYNNHLIDALRYIVTKLKGGGKIDLEVMGGSEEKKENMFTTDGFVDIMEVNENDDAIWENM
jgi:phage terminase large subunit